MNLHGRVALITEASSGIGRAAALRLAEAGADLTIGYGRQEQAARVTAESRVSVYCLELYWRRCITRGVLAKQTASREHVEYLVFKDESSSG
jgi:NAD(P)-dependent dehydrogenase (short-subunit alcohol dehydrogenase family)